MKDHEFEFLSCDEQLIQSERLAAIGQMINGLAHTSRNAIQRARSCVDLLELDLHEQPELLGLTVRIRMALSDLLRNYEDVQKYATPIVLHLQLVDSVALLERAFQELRNTFPNYRHRLILHGSTSESFIQGDEIRLLQVFRNILRNSMEASNPHSEIAIQLQSKEINSKGFQEIVIRDTGVGMDDSTLAQIFDPFFTTKQSGSGLGLAVCKRIVESHSGKIYATTKRGNGTTVTLLFPIQIRESR
ncbi:MAG: ATP-binding protein [Pirellulaceae bacterium]|nr:ATP-binding protein [Pirellulaceae bacterium]